MTAKSSTPKPPQKSQISEQKPKSSDGILRILLPIGLAIMAAILNAAAVSRQMQTTELLVFSEDLPIGHTIEDSDLRIVKLGGELSTISPLAIAASERQELIGRVLDRSVAKGEIVVTGAFGGTAIAQENEETIVLSHQQVSREVAEVFRPGQNISFRVWPVGVDGEAQKKEIIEIGPVRVAAYDKNQKENRSRGALILIFPKTEEGQDQARGLIEYLGAESKYRVVPIVHGESSHQS